jgi:hypothetical protein
MGHPSGLFPSGFQAKIVYVFVISPTHATCPAYLFLLDFIIQIIFGEEQNYEAPLHAVISCLLFPPCYVHKFPSASCSQTPSIFVLPLM